MVGGSGAGADANANADMNATSPRLGSRLAKAEASAEDAVVNVTPSGQASDLPRRAAASLSRDGDDRLRCHRTMARCGGLVRVCQEVGYRDRDREA
ncbi:hypothetical protein F4808DRAFT_373891 [Astrocystis sublimbata]|nr:hypothetical protein F4808DRAFT_373891 [Astrocystis sublimbata]